MERQQQQKMKSSTIEALHLGKQRRVDKQQYCKLRPYNKIQSSRVQDGTLSSPRSTLQEDELTQEQLADVVACLLKDNDTLRADNDALAKLLRKEAKIEKAVAKKAAQLGEHWEEEYLANNAVQHRDLVLMNELDLSLRVIELESLLQDKEQTLKYLGNAKRRAKHLDSSSEPFQLKKKFLSNIFVEEQALFSFIQSLRRKQEQLKQLIESLQLKLRTSHKNKQGCQKKLQQAQYQLKEAEEQTQSRKRRLRKDSCQYIEIENGQVRSEQDIRNEISELRARRLTEEERLQTFIEETMRDKISIITEIERYQVGGAGKLWDGADFGL